MVQEQLNILEDSQPEFWHTLHVLLAHLFFFLLFLPILIVVILVIAGPFTFLVIWLILPLCNLCPFGVERTVQFMVLALERVYFLVKLSLDLGRLELEFL